MKFVPLNAGAKSNVFGGVIGLFYAMVLMLIAWVGSSLYEITLRLPVLESQLSNISEQVNELSTFRTLHSVEESRFTAADGATLARFVQELETRLTVVESSIQHYHSQSKKEN